MAGIIANNTALSNFAAAGRLDVLRRVVSRMLVTREVYDEVLAGIGHGHHFQEATAREISEGKWIRVAQITSQELDEYAGLREFLGPGEASSILVARRRGLLFLTDDRRARKFCQAEDIDFSGTLGILQEAVRRDVLGLDAADAILHEMVKRGYYSPVRSLSDL